MKIASAAAPLAVPASVRETLQAALAASKSPNTHCAYSTAWSRWAADHGCAELPADPAGVAAYLAARWQGGSGLPTLRLAVAAIAAAHDLTGNPGPSADRTVKIAMQGFARMAADQGKASPKQVAGLTAEAVAAIRGSLNGQAETISDALTMAIVSTMADARLRRSEAAALQWADIEAQPGGSGRVTVRRGKTDQDGQGVVVAITPAAMADLERLAGHSGRVGMAQRMTRNQAPAAAVMRQGRWQSARMVARYTRNESAAEALRYL